LTEPIELAVIGAGPAGLAAAMTADEAGLDVTVFDGEPAPGGQIYKAVGASPLADIGALGPDYADGASLVAAFHASGCRHVGSTDVWTLTPDGEIGLLSEDRASFVRARRIIIATGAQERPVPFEGWTLPGAMTAGAGQVLVKTAGVVPAGGVVLAGLGPLMLLLAWQYVRLGVKVRAVLDMTPAANFVRAARYLPAALTAGDYIAKGWRLHRDLKRAGIPIHHRVTRIRAIGTERVEAVEFAAGRRTRRIETPIVLTHFGLVPETSLTRALRIAHHWDDGQQCWRPRVDDWGRTDRPRIQIAGDGRGIFGAKSAIWSGQLAALEAARAADMLSQTERDAKAAPIRGKQRRDHRVRPFLEALYAPGAPDWRRLPDAVIVCRCEEATAGDVRAAARAGAIGANQVKVFTRAGMGPCQGRQCGLSVARLMADATGRPIGEVELPRSRFPLRPIPLGALADMEPPAMGEEVP
jgi:thioredoxin reductase